MDLPELDWGKGEPRIPQWAIDRMGLKRAKRAGELAFKGGGKDSAPRIGTPTPFRDLLLSIAETASAYPSKGKRVHPEAWLTNGSPMEL